MKRIGSLFIVLAMVLTMIGTGTIFVSAAPVVDNVANTMTYTEDFEGLTLNKSATDRSQIYVTKNQDFKIILGSGEFKEKAANDNLSGLHDGGSGGTSAMKKIFRVDRMPATNDTVAIKFPVDISSGTFTVSFDGKVANYFESHFGSLVNVDNAGVLQKSFVDVMGQVDTTSTYIGSTIANGTEQTKQILGQTGGKENFNRYTYVVDMDNKTVVLTAQKWNSAGTALDTSDGATVTLYGALNIADGDTINALYFGNKINQNSTYGYRNIRIDNVSLTVPIPAKNVTFKDADGETIETITAEGGKVTPPTVTPESGKVFLGWVKKGTTEHFNDFDNILEDMTLVAVYGDRKISENFDDFTFSRDENDKPIISIGESAIDIVLNSAGTYKQNNRDEAFNTGAGGRKLFRLDRMITTNDTVAIKFPDVSQGIVKISFEAYSGTSNKQSYFASVINADSDDIIVPVYGQNNKVLVGTEELVASPGVYNKYTYYIDMTNKEYTVEVDYPGDTNADSEIDEKDFADGVIDKTITGRFDASGSANALYFNNTNGTNSTYGFRLDNLEIDYAPVIIGDSVDEEIDGEGIEKTLGAEEIFTIAQDGFLKNATIDATRGTVKIGKTEITGGKMTFNDKGEVDAEVGSTIKFLTREYTYTLGDKVYSSEDGSTAQAFVSKQESETGTYVINMSAKNGNDADTKTGKVEFKVSEIFEGPLRFMAYCVGVPSGYVIYADECGWIK